MSDKKKLIGRVVYDKNNLDDSQVYWTCPSRKCQAIHIFTYIFPKGSGTTEVYQKTCEECDKSYLAQHLKTNGVSVMLAVTFNK